MQGGILVPFLACGQAILLYALPESSSRIAQIRIIFLIHINVGEIFKTYIFAESEQDGIRLKIERLFDVKQLSLLKRTGMDFAVQHSVDS
jgi:hypothetical protein